MNQLVAVKARLTKMFGVVVDDGKRGNLAGLSKCDVSFIAHGRVYRAWLGWLAKWFAACLVLIIGGGLGFGVLGDIAMWSYLGCLIVAGGIYTFKRGIRYSSEEKAEYQRLLEEWERTVE